MSNFYLRLLHCFHPQVLRRGFLALIRECRSPGGRGILSVLTSEGELNAVTGDQPDDATKVASPAAKRRVVPDSLESQPSLGQIGHVSANSSQRGTGGSFSGTASSPLDVLHTEEVERTQMFAKLSVGLCALLVVGLPFFGGNATLRYVFIGAVIGCGMQSAWTAVALRDHSRYSVKLITAMAIWAALTTYVGVFFVGIFSVAPMAVVVGIYFFGRSQSGGAALFIYVFVAVMQLALAAIVLGKVVEDPGIFAADHVPFVVKFFIQVLVQALFLIAFALSRSTRASSLRGIEDLQRAMRQVSQREALFQEVRQELDNVLMIGGAGRYSDQEVGQYRLGKVIGRGAMAEVYEGVDMVNGGAAAVKLLHPNVLETHDAAERFLREAKAAGALSSPNAVRVLDASAPGAPIPYLAMELLNGNDLGYWLRKRRRLSVREVVELITQVSGVIDLAAQEPLVHRDIKPQNLFKHEPRDGIYQWKILDFGMSTLGENAGTLTGGHVVGTPAYMAPEQARGKQVDTRADLYSLAAVAYRCLTGRAPFAGKDIPSLLYSVVYDSPPQPSSLVDLPKELDDVLAVALAKKRENRFGTGEELAVAFAAASEGRSDDWLQRRAEALVLEQPWGTKH